MSDCEVAFACRKMLKSVLPYSRRLRSTLNSTGLQIGSRYCWNARPASTKTFTSRQNPDWLSWSVFVGKVICIYCVVISLMSTSYCFSLFLLVLIKFLLIGSINNVSPKPRKVLQLFRLRQINNGTFIKLNKATINMIRMIDPYVAWGYPNLKTVRELVYKRGFGKVNGRRTPLTDNSIIEQQLGKR